MKRLVLWIAVSLAVMPTARAADVQSSEKPRLEEVVVSAEQIEGPFLPDVVGTAIHAGKKTSVIDLQEIPTIVNNNYRQVLAKTPSLLLSEETTPLVSIGYRGLAPDRAQFMQVLKDGVPIVADLFGYPEAYYTPPFQTVDRIEFIHGGASLLYGPQPGGALNFVTKAPAADTRLSAYTEHLFGDDELFSTYTSLTGSVEPLGFYAYLHEREGNGFRQTNSDFEVLGGGLKVTLGQATDSRLTMTYDEYHEEHGEPGGLTKAEADSEGRDLTHRFGDRFRLERYAGTMAYQRDLDEQSQVDVKLFGGHYRRYSKRQRSGGFGTNPTGTTNDIQEQDFYTVGLEPRIRHTYDAFGQSGQTLTAGALVYLSSSPKEDQRGDTIYADTGSLRNRSDREMQHLSLFAEQLFRFDKFSLTPGARLEHIWQGINETVNADKHAAGTAFGDVEEFDFVPLFGIGAAYDATPTVTLYSNFSQSYRPKLFAQAVPTGTNQVVNNDLEEGKGWTFDVGARGHGDVFTWDASFFSLRFDDQIGTSGNTIENVGDALHQGLELSTEVDVLAAADRYALVDGATRLGSLRPFFNLMLLDAKFVDGPQDNKTPQYAPQYTVRLGLQYAFGERVKANLSSLLVDDHFGDDANTTNQTVPSYKVWDLTGEVKVWKDFVTLFGGINNLSDERYYARVTSGGIDPAPERNIYGGVRVGVKF
ncbi:MAG TPA: hypothetical protein DD714_02425 [Candidatus Omnitrophica bacterium]|nr:hypothetical protein [Candidatus Omnitrophota bacterium]